MVSKAYKSRAKAISVHTVFVAFTTTTMDDIVATDLTEAKPSGIEKALAAIGRDGMKELAVGTNKLSNQLSREGKWWSN